MDKPRTIPLSIALLGIAAGVALAGCNRSTPEDTMPAADATAMTEPAETSPPMETTTMMPPATTMPPPASTAMMPPATTTAMPAAGAAMLNDADKKFLGDVGKSNEEEIATTELAMTEGSAKAKALSQMLNADHVALRGQVAALAPGMPAATPGKAPASLSGMKAGSAFDTRLYATYVTQHEGAIKAFTAASKDMALSEPVRSMATQTLPKLQQHLTAVKDAQRMK